MRKKIYKILPIFLSLSFVLSSFTTAAAKEIYSTTTDEMVDIAIAEYGWDKGKMESYQWIGIDGEEYERMYAYEEDMFKDTVTTQEQLAVDYGILSPSDLLNGMFGAGSGSIVAVALREADADDNMEVPLGSNHCKYTEWYGSGDIQWCAVFVVWCANECGLVESGFFPRTAYCDGLWRYFTDCGFGSYPIKSCTQIGGGEYTVVPGDLVFFPNQTDTRSRFGHVGIVTAVGDGYIDITQGNTGDRVQTIRTRYFDYATQVLHVEYPSGTASIFSFLTGQMGLNAAAACGILGNMEAESNCVSYRVQNDMQGPDYPYSQNYTDMVDNGSITEHDFIYNGPGGGGYGLCQWTSYDRKYNLYSLAKYGSVTYSIGDTMVQMQQLKNELETNYSYVLSVLQSVPNSTYGVCLASDVVLRDFERPGTLAYTYRQELCLNYWAQYGGSE